MIDINRPRDGDLEQGRRTGAPKVGEYCVTNTFFTWVVRKEKPPALGKGWRLSRLSVVSGAEPPLFACDGISNLVAAPRLVVRRDPALGLLHVGLNMALAGPLLDF